MAHCVHLPPKRLCAVQRRDDATGSAVGTGSRTLGVPDVAQQQRALPLDDLATLEDVGSASIFGASFGALSLLLERDHASGAAQELGVLPGLHAMRFQPS